jgi:hypothetical protein
MTERDYFERQIVERLSATDGAQYLTLDCGHSLTSFAAVEAESCYCAQCLHEYLATQRSNRKTATLPR